MKITVKQLKQLIKEQVEEVKASIGKQDINEDWYGSYIQPLFDEIDNNPLLEKYLNENADKGEAIVDNIPLSVFSRITGLTGDDVREMQTYGNHTNYGYGTFSIRLFKNKTVSIFCLDELN